MEDQIFPSKRNPDMEEERRLCFVGKFIPLYICFYMQISLYEYEFCNMENETRLCFVGKFMFVFIYL